ncbi:MAG: FHA domain-containing protein [Gemmataceae bacterium]
MNVQLCVAQGRPSGKVLVFGPGEYFLGRGPECHIRFNSDWVSRQHCLLCVSPSAATLTDLGSRNGTLVNGRLLVAELPLVEGDMIQLGPVLFAVHLDPGAPVELRPLEEGGAVFGPGDDADGVPLDSTAFDPLQPPTNPE